MVSSGELLNWLCRLSHISSFRSSHPSCPLCLSLSNHTCSAMEVKLFYNRRRNNGILQELLSGCGKITFARSIPDLLTQKSISRVDFASCHFAAESQLGGTIIAGRIPVVEH